MLKPCSVVNVFLLTAVIGQMIGNDKAVCPPMSLSNKTATLSRHNFQKKECELIKNADSSH
jgi:hypothetical protein